MIAYIVVSISIFIAIFYLPVDIVAILCVVFCISYSIINRSIIVTIKRVLYILPYFISVLAMQALTPRGEAYRVFGFYLDKYGVDTTLVYFLRFTAVLYFLGVVFKFAKNIALPQNRLGHEVVRLAVFFKILRRNFFRNIIKIRDKNIASKQKFIMTKQIISNVYVATFKNYPYDEYISLYYHKNAK